MGKYLLLLVLLPEIIFASAPECPLYDTKKDCLYSVESNYNRFLDFINENTGEEDIIEKDKLIQASLDIKKYESLACQKTCLDEL